MKSLLASISPLLQAKQIKKEEDTMESGQPFLASPVLGYVHRLALCESLAAIDRPGNLVGTVLFRMPAQAGPQMRGEFYLPGMDQWPVH